MNLDEIHFHDAVLLRVIEVTDANDLLMEVDYPVNWQEGVYEHRVIAFRDVIHYKIDETPYEGRPMLLGAYVGGEELGRKLVEIETSAGSRSFHFREVELLSPEEAGLTRRRS